MAYFLHSAFRFLWAYLFRTKAQPHWKHWPTAALSWTPGLTLRRAGWTLTSSRTSPPFGRWLPPRQPPCLSGLVRNQLHSFHWSVLFSQVKSQHPYVETIGEPYVYTVDMKNSAEVERALKLILNQTVRVFSVQWVGSYGVSDALMCLENLN